MKKLYWIDDDFDEMFYVTQGAISKLWHLDDKKMSLDDKVCSRIIIFGNSCRKRDTFQLASQEDEEIACQEIAQLYMERCIRVDGPDPARPVFKNNLKLIIGDSDDMPGPVTFLLKEEDADNMDKFRRIYNAWINPTEGKEGEKREEECNQVKELIGWMKIEKGSSVGIDTLLLLGDNDRIREGKRIISMEIYNQLIKDQYECFLYSSEAENFAFTENWIDTYKKLYADTEDGAEGLSIISRKDLLQNSLLGYNDKGTIKLGGLELA